MTSSSTDPLGLRSFAIFVSFIITIAGGGSPKPESQMTNPRRAGTGQM
jgi:hypothetical protein